MKARIRCPLLIGTVLWLTLFGTERPARATPATTTTTLAVASGGSAVDSVAPESVVTLTATVNAGSTPVTTGQVKFCDAAATSCTGVHILGAAQLTSTGTAALKIVPAVGSHTYKAVFLGTDNNAASNSDNAPLAVSATIPTAASIESTGSLGTFRLTTTVTGSGGQTPPTGTVSFLDVTNGNAVLGTAALEKNAAALNWKNAKDPAIGPGIYALAAGDFNGDGIADLAVASPDDDTITILLGKGDGTFAQPAGSPVAVGSAPVALVAGDFNSDGRLDLAVVNSGDGTVSILLGNGDGTYAEATPSPVTVGAQPRSIAIEDLNRDGIADLAVANGADDTVTILLGKGDGTFRQAAGSPVAAGLAPFSVAAEDFNGDAIPDLAVANGRADTLTILLGNGDGSFTQAPASPITPGFAPTFVTSGDFNGDGNADLAVVNNGNSTVTILLGNGDGTFAQASGSPLKVGKSPYSAVAADFDGDGIADLSVANACGNGPTCSASSYQGTVTILQGNGDGTFTPAAGSPVPAGNWPISIVAADFNSDGIPDLAVANYSSGTLSVLLTGVTETATAAAPGISPSGAGTHLVEAIYSGDTMYAGSTSATTAVNVEPAMPTVTVTPDAASITTAQALSVTITITGGSGDPMPTGSVTLTSGSYASAPTALSLGSATITIPAGSLAVGAGSLTASYTGDNNYNKATGTASVAVTAPPTPSFTITGSAVTLAPGATSGNTSTIAITPAGGFTGSVALTASLASSPAGALSAPTLSFGSSSPVAITTTDAATATLTITTTAPEKTKAALDPSSRLGISGHARTGAALAGILLFGIVGRRKTWRAKLGMFALFVALSGSVLSCSSGAKSTPATTAGNYTIAITGTSGTITATCTVNLTVH